MFLIRENLEGLAAYLATEKMTETGLQRLESCVRGFKEPYRTKEIQRYAREDFRFHQTIIDLSGARRLINLISTLYDQIRIFRLTTMGMSDRMKVSLSEHQSVIEAFRRRDATESERRMREHIRHVRHGVMENVTFFLEAGNRPRSSKGESP